MASKDKSQQNKEVLERTLRRLEAVRDHTANAKGSGRLDGKVAILTGVGSGKGIGRAAAFQYAREGAKALYLIDLQGDLDGLQADLSSKYPSSKIITAQGDVTEEDFVEGLCQRAVDEHGRLDIFFANAGISSAALHPDMVDAEDFMNTLKVNTLSCILAIKHASPAMQVVKEGSGKKDGGGSIILTASVAGMRSGAGPLDYSASKAGVISLAQTSCQTLAGTNVRVNAICPGLIETDMTAIVFDGARSRGTLGNVGQLNPMRRFGIAEEVAALSLFLASDESSYVNGAHIPVDGGLSSSHPIVPGRSF